MGVHKLEKKQLVKAPLKEVWDFFSYAGNLVRITPQYMNFRILSKNLPRTVLPGQIIEYYVSPVAGVKMYWMTEITHVIQEKLFVDEQRKGPYKMWHHQHHFEGNENETLMTDIVHYELPMWWVGDLMHSFFIKKQLEDIFEYRHNEIEKLFNT